jgi:hypothetical protein
MSLGGQTLPDLFTMPKAGRTGDGLGDGQVVFPTDVKPTSACKVRKASELLGSSPLLIPIPLLAAEPAKGTKTASQTEKLAMSGQDAPEVAGGTDVSNGKDNGAADAATCRADMLGSSHLCSSRSPCSPLSRRKGPRPRPRPRSSP